MMGPIIRRELRRENELDSEVKSVMLNGMCKESICYLLTFFYLQTVGDGGIQLALSFD